MVDRRVERDDLPYELALNRLHVRQRRSGQCQCGAEPACDLGRQGPEQRREPPWSTAEIRPGKDDSGARDTNPDLAHTGDCECEGFAVGAADGAEFIAGNDRSRVAGQRRCVAREITQQRGDKRADRAPQRQTYEKTGAVLRKTRRQHHDRDPTHQGADHAKPSLAQRRAEKRLAHQRRGRAGPRSVVEFQPKRDVESKTDRGPQA